MASIVNSFAISGIEGYLVEIETDTIYGQPSISIIGLGDRAIKEASERIQAAIIHQGYEFPEMNIVINLAPGDIKKKGFHFDLGMAIALLIQSKQVIAEDIDKMGFIGQLSLNGKIRSCSGVLPMVLAARKSGIKKIIVPIENVKEACLVKGVDIYGLTDLKSVVEFLEGEKQVKVGDQNEDIKLEASYDIDFADVKGQEILIEYIVVAAAGGHNMLVIEAGRKSGALITAEYAKKQEKELLAVPNNIYQLESVGTNELIRKGANIYLQEEQLLIQNKISIHKDIQIIKQKDDTNQTELDKVETKIIRILLNQGEKTIEELSGLLNKDKMEILEKVSLMELENKIILQGTSIKLS